MLGVGFLVVVVLMTRGRPSQAQSGAAGGVYGEVKDVIEELIKSEITRNVVARVRERSPALGFYFHRTLDRLESSYWGNLSSKLEGDLIVLVGDYVYWSVGLASERRDEAGTRKIAHFFACFDPGTDNEACEPIRTLTGEKDRSLVDRHCRALDRTTAPSSELACNLALATRAGLRKQSSMAIHHVIDAVTNILLHDLEPGPMKRRLRKMAQTWLGDIEQFPADYPDIFQAINVDPDNISISWVEEHCKKNASFSAYFADPKSSSSWICFAASYEGLAKSLSFRIQIDLPKKGGVIRQDLQHGRVAELLSTLENNTGGDNRPIEQRIYSMFVNETILAYCARNMDLRPASSTALFGATNNGASARGIQSHVCSEKSLEFGHPVGASLAISWLDLRFSARALPNKFQPEVPLALARASNRFRIGMRRVKKMRDLVPVDLRTSIFADGDAEVGERLDVLRAFLRIGRLVSELRSRWYLWPEAPELSGAERLRALDLGGLLRLALEEAAPKRSMRKDPRSVSDLLDSRVGLALRKILNLAFRSDRRELAVEGVRLALGLENQAASPPYETFFLSLAGYLLDDGGGDSITVTKAAFRAAAKDLLRTLPSEGVPTEDERFRLRFLPMLSARVAFNENFRNEGGRAGMRSTVAADWPVGYMALSDYAGIHASAIDLVGPLGELALREVGDWQDEELVLLDFLRPKVGAWLAVPQLSRRLILDAGIGIRFVGTKELMGDAIGTYERKTSPEIHFGVSYVL